MQQEAITQFRARFRGELIKPADARCEEARKVYNAMISGKPHPIARPAAFWSGPQKSGME